MIGAFFRPCPRPSAATPCGVTVRHSGAPWRTATIRSGRTVELIALAVIVVWPAVELRPDRQPARTVALLLVDLAAISAGLGFHCSAGCAGHWLTCGCGRCAISTPAR